MLIGIDGFEASVGQRVGVGRLAVELIKGLGKIDKRNKYRVYIPQEKPENKFLPTSSVGKAVVTGQSGKWKIRWARLHRLWSQAALPFYLYKDKPRPDVFLSPSHYAPRFCPCPSVIFVFDLSYIYFPDMFKRRDLYKLKNWTAYSVRKAAKIITISKASKADIMQEYSVDSNKVKVVYPGIDLRIESGKLKVENENKMKSVLSKYGIQNDYILYVGTLQPRKNLVKLIEAFRKSKEQRAKNKEQRRELRGLKLVIVGKKGWMWEEIFAKVKELRLENEVIFTGFVPDEELPVFYKNAKLLALVSLYEGFGLPVVEAMASGTPVVVSNVSSLPEAAGNAGVYVNPRDADDIAKGIRKVLQMNKKQYAALAKESKKQAKKFSWEKTARAVLKVFEEVRGEG